MFSAKIEATFLINSLMCGKDDPNVKPTLTDGCDKHLLSD